MSFLPLQSPPQGYEEDPIFDTTSVILPIFFLSPVTMTWISLYNKSPFFEYILTLLKIVFRFKTLLYQVNQVALELCHIYSHIHQYTLSSSIHRQTD